MPIGVEPASEPDWPAPAAALDAGRRFLRTAAAAGRVVVAADRDVDGLTAALLVARAVERLGGAATIVPPRKGENVHVASLQERLAAAAPSHLVVVDQGSRAAPILRGVPTLLVDHHQPAGFPPGAVVVSAFGHEPVAPTALLAWELVRPLTAMDDLEWLAALGTAGDLGASPPFPDMVAAIKRAGRKHVSEAVSLLNAARRDDDHAADVALTALAAARSPADVATGRVPGSDDLRRFRARVQTELGRAGFAAPRFAGQFALVRISSPAQVHPLLAARWAQRLPKHVAIVANDGYVPGRVNFAMRTRTGVNMVELLRALPLDGAEGEWGFGHPQATGGSLAPPDFDRLLALLGFTPPAARTAP
jgi:single-stranded DNA-specific DHH superfamily exonuclease